LRDCLTGAQGLSVRQHRSARCPREQSQEHLARHPRRQITVLTGGKSSLVFDAIAAESQWLINETFSTFVQLFLPRYGQPIAPASISTFRVLKRRAVLGVRFSAILLSAGTSFDASRVEELSHLGSRQRRRVRWNATWTEERGRRPTRR